MQNGTLAAAERCLFGCQSSEGRCIWLAYAVFDYGVLSECAVQRQAQVANFKP